MASKKKMSKKKKFRLFLVLLICILIIVAAGYTLFILPNISNEEIVYKENTAEYGSLQNKVTESGTVTFGITSEKYDLDISTDDDDDDDDDDDEEEEKYLKVEEVYVAVGQRIKEGDPIYKFTKESIEDIRKSLNYAKTEAEIALAQANTQYQIGQTTAKLSKDETLLALALSEQNYNVSVAKLYNDIATDTLKIEQTLIEINQTLKSLVEEDYTEQKESVVQTYEKALDALEEASDAYFTRKVSANKSFRTAREAYNKFFDQYDETYGKVDDKIEEIYDLETNIEKNQRLIEKELLTISQELETAKVNGEIADNKYASSIEQYENSVKSSTDELEEATKKLEDFNEFVGDGIVYSTGTGIVTEMGYEVDDYLMRAGTMFSYATNDDMTISVDVSQEDVVTMAVGDFVNISFTAYENEVYEGVIQSITTTATSKSKATISYPVVISILGDTTKLYEGMTADVTFITEETPETVYVSRKAIVEENQKKYVYIKNKDDYILTPVTTGSSYGEYIEIKSGLEAGEKYYIRSVVAVQETKSEDKASDTKDDSTTNGQDFDSSSFDPSSFDFNGGSLPQGMDFNGGERPSFSGKSSGGGFK